MALRLTDRCLGKILGQRAFQGDRKMGFGGNEFVREGGRKTRQQRQWRKV